MEVICIVLRTMVYLSYIILIYMAHNCIVYGEILDLSYGYDENRISYHESVKTKFDLTIVQQGPWHHLPWAAWNEFETSEHMGTHIDAPYHFYEHGRKVEELTYDMLHGPAVVIDIRARAAVNPNATVLEQDLISWEHKHGRIPEKAFVVMKSGWQKYWGDPKYNGVTSVKSTKPSSPGFSSGAIDWLLAERSINGITVDTLSTDTGDCVTYPVHIALAKAAKVGLENMANVHKIPESGAYIFLFPMKIVGGSGGPTRAYATWGRHKTIFAVGSAKQVTTSLTILMLVYSIEVFMI